jgi:hypothetical protein
MSGKPEDLSAGDLTDIEGVFAALESVARNYPEGSLESRSIELAARALGFVSEARTRDAFKDYLASSDRPLSDEQKEHLRLMGVEP